MDAPGSAQAEDSHADDWVVVGRVLGPWGIRGDVRVEPHSDSRERFSPGSRVYLNGAETAVVSSRPHRGGLVVRLGSVADRTAAETLKNAALTVPLRPGRSAAGRLLLLLPDHRTPRQDGRWRGAGRSA